MKLRMFYPGLFAGLFIVASTLRCTPQQAKTVQTIADDVLPIAQLICIETSNATTVDGVKAVCDGIDKLTPSQLNFVVGLLEQKRAAEKTGYLWAKPDAGAK